jgi:hypothetical protein
MARDPDKRFQTATEVANLLARCLAHVQQPLAVPLPDEAIPEEARPNAGRTRRRRWAVGTLALLAFGGGTLALMGPWEARHESGVTARHAALDDLVPVRADQITQEMQQAWSRAESLQANLHGRGDQPEHDRVLELANQLAGKVRSLERELTTGDATLRAPADLPYFQP